MPTHTSHIGIVVIGRNEGDRLRRCLDSVVGDGRRVVYVDSGSTDGSVALARSLGAEVVELDLARPFSAARGRNAGLRRLLDLDPSVRAVQFVDGDCEVNPGWLRAALDALDREPGTAAVCGRLRERFPDRSIYNRLCDVEWDAPTGLARACGGNALFRLDTLVAVGGFDESIIAGEEPELCYRLRRAGHRIRRLPEPMALHDADMLRFAQWWKRAARGGYALAHGAALHGREPERYNVKRLASVLAWGLALPLLGSAWALGCLIVAAWSGAPWSRATAALIAPAPIGLYLVLGARVALHHRRRGRSLALACLVASFTLLAKFAEAQGVIRFWRARGTRRPAAVSEFESPAPDARPRRADAA